jgi:restriction system protein
VLERQLSKIDLKYLKQFAEFREFKDSVSKERGEEQQHDETRTPEEILEGEHNKLKNEVLAELLDKVKSSTPAFFENLVVNTVVKMGYGGSLQDAGRAVGKSGDGGIDGIINEDRLGLDVIYLQAKKWEGNVGRPEVHKFAGALQGKRARKGILITTSDFTKEALEYVKNVDAKIILISGQQLCELMWEYNIGLSDVSTYEVKKLDLDYFSE